MQCHVVDGEGGETSSAPPMFAVRHHYSGTYPKRADFVRAVMSWLREPTREKVVMSGAVKKFGLMKKLELDEMQTQQIAEYLYDAPLDIPEWYLVHYKKKHDDMRKKQVDSEKSAQDAESAK